MSHLETVLLEIKKAFNEKNLQKYSYLLSELEYYKLDVCQHGRSIWGPCLACEELEVKENNNE